MTAEAAIATDSVNIGCFSCFGNYSWFSMEIGASISHSAAFHLPTGVESV